MTWDDTRKGRTPNYDGRSQSLNDWAQELDVRPATIRARPGSATTGPCARRVMDYSGLLPAAALVRARRGDGDKAGDLFEELQVKENRTVTRRRRTPDNSTSRKRRDRGHGPKSAAPGWPPGEVSPDVYMELHPKNPIPTVDRRWRIAELVARGFTPWETDRSDPWVQRAVTYLQMPPATGTGTEQPAADPVNIATAVAVHKSDKLTRGTLEARILARLPVDQVAAACGLTVEAVQAYEALFFDVRGHLAYPDYLIPVVIGPKLHYGITAEDVDVVLKHVGYVGGPVLVDWLVDFYTAGVIVPESLEIARPEELRTLVRRLRAKALHLVYVLQYPACCRALRLNELARELEAYAEGLGDAKDAPAEEVAMVAPLGVGQGAPDAGPSPAETSKAPARGPEWWSSWREAVSAA